MAKDKTILLRVTGEEKNQLTKLAGDCGMGVSEYLLAKAFDGKLAITETQVAKPINTPAQAKQAIASLPAKPKPPVDTHKAGIIAAMDGVAMSMSDAKALRFKQSLSRQ